MRRYKRVLTIAKRWGCMITLAESNEDIELELPRAWESLDSSKLSQDCEGSSSHGVLFNGNSFG